MSKLKMNLDKLNDLNSNGIIYTNINQNKLNLILDTIHKKKLVNKSEKVNLIYKKKDINYFVDFSYNKLNLDFISIFDYFIFFYQLLNPNSKKKIIQKRDILFYIHNQLGCFDFKNLEIKSNNLNDFSLDIYETITNFKENNIRLNQFEEIEFKNVNFKIDLFNFMLSYELWKKKNNFLDYYDILSYLLEFNLESLEKNDFLLNLDLDLLLSLDIFLDLENFSPLEILVINNLLNISNFLFNKKEKDFKISLFICNKQIIEIKKNLPIFKKLNFSNSEIISFFDNLELIFDDFSLENSKIIYNYLLSFIENSSFNINKEFKTNSNQMGDFNIFECQTIFDEINLGINYIKKNDISNKKVGFVIDKENLNILTQIFEIHNFSYEIFEGNVDKNLIKKVLFILKIIKDPYVSDIEIFYILKELGFLEEEISYLTRKSALKEKSLYRLFKNNQEIFNSEELNSKLSYFFNKIEFLRESYLNDKSISNLFSLIIEEFRFFLDFRNEFLDDKNNKDLESLLIEVFNLEKIYGKGLDFLISYLTFLNIFNLDIKKKNKIFNSNIFIIPFEEYEKVNFSFDTLFVFNLNSEIFKENVNNYNFFNNFSLNYKENLSINEFYFFDLIHKTKENLFLSYHKKEKNSVLLPFRFLKNFNLNFITINENSSESFNQLRTRNVKLQLIQDICLNLFEGNICAVKDLLSILDKNENNLEDFGFLENKKISTSNNSKNNLRRFLISEDNNEDNNINEKQIEKNNSSFGNNNQEFNNKIDYNKLKEKIDLNRRKNFDSLKVKDNHVYSVSQLNCFKQCPKKYKFQYVLKLKTKPKPYFDFGISVHSVLEEIVPLFEKEKIFSYDLMYSKAINLLERNWISQGYKDEVEEKEYFEKGLKIIADFIKTQEKLINSKSDRKIIGLEKDFLIKINDKNLYGIIDRIDKTGDDFEILDYKTSNSMENEMKLKKNYQLYIYALACKELFGKYPKEIGLWYLVFNNIKKINFDEKILTEIKKEIYELILEIEKGIFYPKPSKFNCTYCDFFEVCDDSFI
jgi:CRISPR/Cas system-associated exonuclease Cas4 (RecB family)